ncbi:response regulator [Paenibacillus antri]|uniref:Response regulator n=1 Tax=Paenibacillus antri TaxID=2582848 RepID=A0A5R9GH74_9BACL|nr:response regulator [Paenibacillus antri]TLS52704.1 response regulator [Paenibacillus antri]
MIKVLVVDDDKLVRQGLISAMPWADFEMEVVGEANNGEKALEFLDRHEVDLLLTDLAMPVMSGIELMRAARARFPSLYIVVLTLHQDFDYIQEALRLGAIDYIAKVQLERERFDEVLGRVYQRMQEERRVRSAAMPDVYAVGLGYALFAGEGEAVYASDPLLRETPFADADVEEVEDGLWLWTCAEQAAPDDAALDAWLRRLGEREGWLLLRVASLTGKRRGTVHRGLRAYRSREYFYAYEPDHRFVDTTADRLVSPPAEAAEAVALQLRDEWLSLEWLREEEAAFADRLRRLREARLPAARLETILFVVESEWSRVFSAVAGERPPLPERLEHWNVAEEWFRDVRRWTAEATGASLYSADVAAAVMKAIAIVKDEWNGPLLAADVAKRVNMSRSYFSQCFRDIGGKPFNEYVRTLRMEKAKEYLLHTAKPIQWIAEQTGYQDEKYFSRLFREYAGYLPSEFRSRSSR